MKNNLSYMYLGVSTFLSVLLGICAVKYGPYRELDDYMELAIERDKEYYDEEMAVRLASVWAPEERKLRGTFEESVEVVYNYPTNEWLVIFALKDPRWDRLIIGVRRDSGKIRYYW